MDRAARTLAATTLASSMILVDQTAVPLATPDVLGDLGGAISEGQWILTANVLPLAALMVLGGRLGDLLGLRRVFLAGTVIFALATIGAGAAQDMPMLIAARAIQGVGAALMMPTAVAITSAVYPPERRGWALGVLAGASAFFAALGPVLGGLLTSIDWRLVFLINVPLAVVAVLLTLSSTPDFRPAEGSRSKIDYAGTVTFGLGIAALVLGLSQGQADGWGASSTVGPLAASVLLLVAFVVIELRVESPLLEFRLFRHLNFLAANVSQFLAGMIELGLGFLMPFFLLLVVGVSPEIAGIALIPATIPIILAGPLAGRAFDKVGGRAPLVFGYLVLAASGIALAAGVGEQNVGSLVPGLLLQGLGLGVVLTVNDPTGLGAFPRTTAGRPRARSTRRNSWAARSGSPPWPPWRSAPPSASPTSGSQSGVSSRRPHRSTSSRSSCCRRRRWGGGTFRSTRRSFAWRSRTTCSPCRLVPDHLPHLSRNRAGGRGGLLRSRAPRRPPLRCPGVRPPLALAVDVIRAGTRGHAPAA